MDGMLCGLLLQQGINLNTVPFYTGINISTIEELVVINTFVYNLGDKEKTKAYCVLAEVTKIKLKLV